MDTVSVPMEFLLGDWFLRDGWDDVYDAESKEGRRWNFEMLNKIEYLEVTISGRDQAVFIKDCDLDDDDEVDGYIAPVYYGSKTARILIVEMSFVDDETIRECMESDPEYVKGSMKRKWCGTVTGNLTNSLTKQGYNSPLHVQLSIIASRESSFLIWRRYFSEMQDSILILMAYRTRKRPSMNCKKSSVKYRSSSID
jgi:hypothetical protein